MVNFLKAKEAKYIEYYENCAIEMQLLTESCYVQNVYFDMLRLNKPKKIDVSLTFDEEHPAPKRVSLSAIQYAFDDMKLEVVCIKHGETEPYFVKELDGIRTMLEVEPNTSKIIITCRKKENMGKAASIKLSANYIKF